MSAEADPDSAVSLGAWSDCDEAAMVAEDLINTYYTYVPNKTISVPSDVVPIIDNLDIPFSRWVTEQLRLHAAQSSVSFAQQLEADAALVRQELKLTRKDALAAGQRMERSAPW